jgi:PTS system mannose-specific IIC component
LTEPLAIVLLSILAGAVALDTTAVLQMMFSQPLVAGTCAGLILGQPETGLLIGTALELVWVGVLPVGGAVFPDTGPASVVGVGLAGLLISQGTAGGWAISSGLFVALGVAALGRLLTVKLRRLNVRLAEEALSSVERGDLGGVRRAILRAVGFRFTSVAVLSAAVLALTVPFLGRVFEGVAVGEFPALLWAAPIAAGTILAVGRGRFERVLLGAGFLAGVLVVAVR